MRNLKSVRIQNTAAAVRDVVSDIKPGNLNEMDQVEGLSSDERDGLTALVRAAADLLEMLPVGVLTEAGVNLGRLLLQDDIRSQQELLPWLWR